jgi:photosystem II stability/assembly factor-like uncharacterized protein
MLLLTVLVQASSNQTTVENTWTQLANGLPTEGVGRIGLAVSQTNHNRVYAIVDAKEGGLFSSSDAGATWTKVSGDNRIWGRGWYFNKVTADPKDPDTVYVQNTSVYKSTNGGKSWTPIKGAPGGDDYHQLWINPDDPKRMIVASDQGLRCHRRWRLNLELLVQPVDGPTLSRRR